MLANSTPRAGAVKAPSDAIDREPLTGRARNEFEASLYARVKRSGQLVLRILLDHAGGRADCWPSNRRVAEIAGYTARNVQIILRGLEAAGLVRCVADRSLRTQRRIIVVDHPNALRVLSRLGISWMQLGAKAEPRKPAEKVHSGTKNPVHVGVKSPVHVGVKDSSPELSISNIEALNSVVRPLPERPEKTAERTRPRAWEAIFRALGEQDPGIIPQTSLASPLEGPPRDPQAPPRGIHHAGPGDGPRAT